MSAPVFHAFNDRAIAARCRDAHTLVIYVAPGIHEESARAICEVARRGIGAFAVLDVADDVIRAGYGSFGAVGELRRAGITPMQSNGIRLGLLVVDEEGWLFTPCPQSIEPERQTHETPNAVQINREQTNRILDALGLATESQSAPPQEVDYHEQAEEEFKQVEARLEAVPPAPVDLTQIENVYRPLIKYVELHLRGAKLSRKTLSVPNELLYLVQDPLVREKFKLSFKMAGDEAALSVDMMDARLGEIRKEFLRQVKSLGGMVIPARRIPEFERAVQDFERELESFKRGGAALVDRAMKTALWPVAQSLAPLVGHYAARDFPQLLLPGMDEVLPDARGVLAHLIELLPAPSEILDEIKLTCRFKDVTYQMHTDDDLPDQLRRAFPGEHLDAPLEEHRAAQEAQDGFNLFSSGEVAL